tara:strand:+ start:1804 stop:2331 length:528 start_codon:yes stop_codon:yes gene_type:complete
MKIINTKFNGLKIIKGKTFYDKRGFLREILKNKLLNSKKFIFWIASKSKKNTIRGLHLQKKFQQGKYVSVIEGKIFDVALDLRKKSKTFGKYFSIILSEKNSKSIFIPAGFAHGFCGLDKSNRVLYGCTNYRSKKDEVGIIWNDKSLKIKWPTKKPIISRKDRNNITFKKFKNLY